jgi:2-polyprenyl-6-methoxyphenol hydroxylase-like FAD-dependent oxidoreductase
MRVLRVVWFFFAGDSAHQLTPTGGFSMRTVMQDLHNLAWKIAGVIHGRPGDKCIDSNDVEHRSAAHANFMQAATTAMKQMESWRERIPVSLHRIRSS